MALSPPPTSHLRVSVGLHLTHVSQLLLLLKPHGHLSLAPAVAAVPAVAASPSIPARNIKTCNKVLNLLSSNSMASSGAEFYHFHIHQVCPSVFNKQPSLNVSCYTPELTIISCVIVYFWCKYVLLRMTVFGGVVVHSADGRIQWRFMMKEINKGSLYPPEQSWYITHHRQVFKVDCFTTNSQGHFSLEDCHNFMWNSAAQNMIIESCSNDNKSNTVDQN